MGSARVISGLATRLRPDEGLVLSPGYVEDWKGLRAELERGGNRGGSNAGSATIPMPTSRTWSTAASS